MRKGRIYIAGPMTGLPEYNFLAFTAAAKALQRDCIGIEIDEKYVDIMNKRIAEMLL